MSQRLDQRWVCFPGGRAAGHCWAPASPACSLHCPGTELPVLARLQQPVSCSANPNPPQCSDAMFFSNSAPKMVEGSTSFVRFLMNQSVLWTCAHQRYMASLRPHVPSAFPFNEAVLWAEDREATPTAEQLHHFM